MSGSAEPPAALVATLRAAGCVFAEDEARLLADAAPAGPERDRLVALRVGGKPLEHVLGWAEFAGLRIEVDDGVFVPRRRSVLLVQHAVAALARRSAPLPVVVDLCCGTGAIGAAIAHLSGGPVELHAADLDPRAITCARRNLEPFAGLAHLGDLDAPLPRRLAGRVAVLVANAPYVPSDALGLMPREARDHEAAMALDGGADGLDLLRRVVGIAPRWLAPDGVVLVEVAESQVTAMMAAVSAAGLCPQVVADDELGATAVLGHASPTDTRTAR